ncbi:MAG: hypothetical protein LBQ83_01605 [Candidatus Margulisbacteria bacterium]|jgi:hypothetical protein|nr:hypothetical protein [Candidatus Margulisiibacteriota bacterium]
MRYLNTQLAGGIETARNAANAALGRMDSRIAASQNNPTANQAPQNTGDEFFKQPQQSEFHKPINKQSTTSQPQATVARPTGSMPSGRSALEADGWKFFKGSDGEPDMMTKTIKTPTGFKQDAIFDTTGDGDFGRGDQIYHRYGNNDGTVSSMEHGRLTSDIAPHHN